MWSVIISLAKGFISKNLKEVIVIAVIVSIYFAGYFLYKDYVKTKNDLEITENQRDDLQKTLEEERNRTIRTIDALERKMKRIENAKAINKKNRDKINNSPDSDDGELAPVLRDQLRRMRGE